MAIVQNIIFAPHFPTIVPCLFMKSSVINGRIWSGSMEGEKDASYVWHFHAGGFCNWKSNHQDIFVGVLVSLFIYSPIPIIYLETLVLVIICCLYEGVIEMIYWPRNILQSPRITDAFQMKRSPILKTVFSAGISKYN